ncbi:endo-1,4-beta-xylanase [Actinopolymorpha sp. B9G3]|uniref:endo-1,4-beta-xylanase n=1 Tax=Actinopolymorpha sp. B9G3 TaxID=3158970 RepID=UPI0032D8B9CB
MTKTLVTVVSVSALALAPAVVATIGTSAQASVTAATSGDRAAKRDGLRDVGPRRVRIGSAVAVDALRDDSSYRETLAREFNSVTAENAMKWQSLEPQQGVFNFGPADEIVDFAEDHDQAVYGHTLLWHNQLPTWLTDGVASGDITDDELRAIVKDHIQTVVSHYKGRVEAWDVVNEPMADDGSLRQSIFYQHLGPNYIADAFRWAHQADPDAKLYLNDYNVEWSDPADGDFGHYQRHSGYYQLVKNLVDAGVPIDGVGVQGHFSINGYMSRVTEPYDLPHLVENLRQFSDLGLKTTITEADLGMPMPPDSVKLHAQAYGYTALMQMCLQTPGCERYTVWGFTDNYSWIPGHRAGWGAATLFDTTYQPKPAYQALHATLTLARYGRLGPPPTGGLRDVMPRDMRIGSAVAVDALRDDSSYRETLAREFNSVTAENAMKWQSLEPQQGVFNFGPADEIVDFAEDHDQAVYGHTLLWHNQLPTWLTDGVASGDITDDELRAIVKDHIQTVVSHYKGRVEAWDVVNEPMADDGSLRQSIFYQHLGPNYIADAFRWAHQADPDAKLYLNDYNVEWSDPADGDFGHYQRHSGYYQLVKNLVDAGVPIDGVGVQGHFSINGYMSRVTEPYDLPHLVENLRQFSDLGLKTTITEADLGMPMPPDSVKLHAQAYGYTALMQMCLQTPGCERYTVWGFTDNYSWIPGHRAGWGAATLFDTTYQPKPAYQALHATLTLAGPCVHDDLRETVVVGKVDSRVRNRMNAEGCTINDLIRDDRDWESHDAFLQHVQDVTSALVASKLISLGERELIMDAAGRSDVGL